MSIKKEEKNINKYEITWRKNFNLTTYWLCDAELRGSP